MNDFIKVCRCRHPFKVHVSNDIGFYFRWDGDYYLVDVALIVEGSHLSFILYRQVYGFE